MTPTPLPEPDRASAVELWERAIGTGAVPAETPLPEHVGAFGDNAGLADELLDLIVHGPKRATAGSADEYARSGDPMPRVGDYWIATDGAGRARAVLLTTDVRVGPLSSVDDAFAWDEGEGDRTRDDWLRAHTVYFQRSLSAAGLAFDPEMATVFERFELVYAE